MWRARALRAEAQTGQLIAEKAALNEQVARLAAQVEQLTQTVATLTGILFGDSSEKKKPLRQPDGRDGDDDGDGVQARGPVDNATGFRHLGVSACFPGLVTVGSSRSRACGWPACRAGRRPVPRAGGVFS